MTLHHDNDTLRRVFTALVNPLLEDGPKYMTEDEAQDAIRRMQNAGILFREYETEETTTTTTEVTTEAWQELELAKDEEDIRTRALEFAVNSGVRGAGNVEALTARADLFVDYIKNGSSNG